jgi:hypothetical protein
MTYNDFSERICNAGLRARRCSEFHWQISGGDRIVNCWPNSKRGFVFQSDLGGKAKLGSLDEAIQASGGPGLSRDAPFDADPKKLPSPESRPPGVIRRFWRWFW